MRLPLRRVTRRKAGLLVAAALATVALSSTAALTTAPPAHALIMGVEANGEFANPGTTPAQQAAAFDRLQAQGSRLLRVNVSWKQIAANCGDQSVAAQRVNTNACYDWSVYDSLVAQARERGVQLLFSVSRAPFWVNRSNNASFVGTTSGQWKRTVAYYPAFITAIATRYRASSAIGSVKLWTIWNEPNSSTFWAPLTTSSQRALAPGRYAILYAAGAKALKAASPTSIVAPGPTGPNSTIKPVPYIKAFQRVVGRYLPGSTITKKRYYLGAWAHNPYPVIYAPTGNPRYGYNSYLSRDALGMSDVSELTRLLDAAPITRGLKVWATEFGWETNPPERTAFGISAALQARYIPEAYDLLDRTGRVTIGVSYILSDPPADVSGGGTDFQSGTYTNAGAPKPSRNAYQRMISTNATVVRRGARVSVYAKANTDPQATRISYSTNGVTWRLLPLTGANKRRADGSIRASVRMARTLRFATWDGSARGPVRVVVAR